MTCSTWGVDMTLEDRPRRGSIPTFQLTHKVKIKVKRYIGEWNKGRYVIKDIPEDFIIEGNVQPFRFQEILQLPESDRTKEWIKIFTTDHLITAEESSENGNEADRVIWEGNEYKVMKQRHYRMGVLDHNHAIAVRVVRSAK